jgi:hypothetical protein
VTSDEEHDNGHPTPRHSSLVTRYSTSEAGWGARLGGLGDGEGIGNWAGDWIDYCDWLRDLVVPVAEPTSAGTGIGRQAGRGSSPSARSRSARPLSPSRATRTRRTRLIPHPLRSAAGPPALRRFIGWSIAATWPTRLPCGLQRRCIVRYTQARSVWRDVSSRITVPRRGATFVGTCLRHVRGGVPSGPGRRVERVSVDRCHDVAVPWRCTCVSARRLRARTGLRHCPYEGRAAVALHSSMRARDGAHWQWRRKVESRFAWIAQYSLADIERLAHSVESSDRLSHEYTADDSCLMTDDYWFFSHS